MKKFDLSGLRLDETGRVVIEPTQLDTLEKDSATQTSGAGIFTDDGLNTFFCGGETNGVCTNWYDCDGSTNRKNCLNDFCDDSTNELKCKQDGCPPQD
jgi:hypothetical protein